MRMGHYIFLGIFLAASFAEPATAQDTAIDSAEAAKRAREAAEQRIDAQMQSIDGLPEALADTLGRLHWLRRLCFGDQDQTWRDAVQAMLDVETDEDPYKRSDLIAAFNEGYYAEQARHTDCTQAVSVDAAALSENGRQLATMLGDPYREK